MDLGTLTQLCNNDPCQDIQYFCHPQEFFHVPLVVRIFCKKSTRTSLGGTGRDLFLGYCVRQRRSDLVSPFLKPLLASCAWSRNSAQPLWSPHVRPRAAKSSPRQPFLWAQAPSPHGCSVPQMHRAGPSCLSSTGVDGCFFRIITLCAGVILEQPFLTTCPALPCFVLP